MYMCSLLLCRWKRVFAMTSVFSWQNSISLCPASFRTPRPNLPVTPGVSWLPTFAFQTEVRGIQSSRDCPSDLEEANKHAMNCLWPEAHDKAWGQLQGAECAHQDPSRQWGLQSYGHKELNSDSNQGSWKRPLSCRHDHSLIWHLDSAWKDPKQRDQNCKIISRYCFKVLSM